MILRLDYETYCDLDIKKVGVFRYTEHRSFELLLLAYQFEGEKRRIVDIANGEKIPNRVLRAMVDDTIVKTGYNVLFEFLATGARLATKILRLTGKALVYRQWRCTMVKTMMLGYPGGLERVSSVIGLEQKDPRGKRLITKFCTPKKPTAKNPSVRVLPEDAWDDWYDFKEYCLQDVATEESIDHYTNYFSELPEFEKPLFEMDYEINSFGVGIDMKLVRAAIALNEVYISEQLAKITRITGIDNPNSGPQLLTWLNIELGGPGAVNTKMVVGKTGKLIKKTFYSVIEKLDKETVAEWLKREDISREVRAVLELRQKIAKTSISKYYAMRQAVMTDGRVRGTLQYVGAGRTWRWAGRLIQVHNFPKNEVPGLEYLRQLVLEGNRELIELLYGDVSYCLSQLLRTALVPREGYKLVISDFSAIEARVVAWLANEKWRLKAIREGRDIYVASYAQMFNVPESAVTKAMRQIGKVAELALGYQGGVNALGTMDKKKLLVEEEKPGIVSAWREASPAIVALWDNLNRAAIACVRERRRVQAGHIAFELKNNTLYMVLPSGRKLSYLRPRLDEDKWGRDCVSYEGTNQKTGKWGRIKLYGGLLTENAAQAIARDLLAIKTYQIKNTHFYECPLHVHDENVWEVPTTNTVAMTNVNRIMAAEDIDWAKGLPLNAVTFESPFYRKDD